MKHVGIFDAKTHFSELVERVVREGCAITVTRRGIPVVDIVPTQALGSMPTTREEAIVELIRLRETLPRLSREEIRAAIDEGRR